MYAPWQNEAPRWQFIDENIPPFLDLAGDQVVMLVGSGRSGTTWVQNLINYRQDHRVLFEPFWREKVPFLPALPSAHPYLRPEDPALSFRPAAMRILSGQLYTPWTDRRKTPVIYHRRLIKEIRAHLMLKWLVTQMPSLKIVFLLRHPCAVSHSLVKLGWPRDRTTLAKMCRQPTLLADFLSPFVPLIEATQNPFEKNILMWAVQNYVALKQFGLHPADLPQAAAADPHHNQIALFFYEELCTNPEAELPRLFNFLQLPLRDEVAAAWRKPSWTSTKKSAVMTGESLLDAWRSEVTPQQIERAVALLQPFGLDQVYNTDSMPCYPDRMKRACEVRAEVLSLSSTAVMLPVSTSSTSVSTSSTSVSTGSTGALMMNGEPACTTLSPATATPACTRLTARCTTWLGDAAGVRPACCTAHLKELLFFAHEMLTACGIVHWLDFGALLGAVRCQALNPWDDHVDIAFLDSEPSLIPLLVLLFQEAGYDAQYDPDSGDELKIIYSATNHNYLKLSAYRRTDAGLLPVRWMHQPENGVFPAHFLENMASVTLYDRTFPAPAPLHDFLINHRYGPSYQLPIRALDRLSSLVAAEFTPTVGVLLQELAQLLQIRGQWERQIQASSMAQTATDAFLPPLWPLDEDRLARLIGKSYQQERTACASKLGPFWQSLHRTDLLDKRVRRKYHTTLSGDEITPAVYLLLYYIAQEKARVQTLTKMAGVICE